MPVILLCGAVLIKNSTGEFEQVLYGKSYQVLFGKLHRSLVTGGFHGYIFRPSNSAENQSNLKYWSFSKFKKILIVFHGSFHCQNVYKSTIKTVVIFKI